MLARSTYLRYCEALGRDIGDIPSGLYPGIYLKDVGEALASKVGDRYLDLPETEWLDDLRQFAIQSIMGVIKQDLIALGIHMDVFSSERSLVESGAVQHAVDQLQAAGHLYTGVLAPPKGKEPEGWEPREQLLFKAAEFGDDTDRPLQKSDGSWTYFAADVAYHLNKLERTKGQLINIFGADHHGYVTRLTSAFNLIKKPKQNIEHILYQLVNLYEGGRKNTMSTRKGKFLSLNCCRKFNTPQGVSLDKPTYLILPCLI